MLRTAAIHESTEFTLTAVGSGLSEAHALSLKDPAGTWDLPLEIGSQDDNLLEAHAAIAAHVPGCLVGAITNEGSVGLATLQADPPPPALDPTGSSCQETYHETILPFPMIQPKDFAFVAGAWTPGGYWKFHLFYIRQNQTIKADTTTGIDFTEKNIGHATSEDLITWPMRNPDNSLAVDTMAIAVRPGATHFDSKHVWAPCIVKNGLTFTMFYTGVDDNDNQSIGLATSTDLVTWTQRATPVVTEANLGTWATPRGANQLKPVQLRDPFVMPDPDIPGAWLMYFVTIPTAHLDAQIVGVIRSNGSNLTDWTGGNFPLNSTLHPYPGPGQFEADVESPSVFKYQGKWWLFYSIRETRPIFAVSTTNSPIDQNTNNWTPGVDTNSLIIDEFTNQPTNAYYYWHSPEYLQVGAENVAFLAGWNDQDVGISYIRVLPAQSPYLFKEHCPLTTDVGPVPVATMPQLDLVGQRPGVGVIKMRVDLPQAGNVQLSVYDVLGRRVKILVAGELRAGPTECAWNGSSEGGPSVMSGVYFFKLEAAGVSRTARAVLLRP
jgi:hypothetical protein